MATEQEITTTSESIDGAIIQEIGSPDGAHEEVFMDEPDIQVVYDGEIESRAGDEEVEAEATAVEETPQETESVEQTPDIAVVDTEAPAEAAAVVSPETDTAVTVPETAQAETVEATSPQTQPTRESFKLHVDRQEYEVPGAYVDGDNIVIPKEAFQRAVQPMLGDRNVWRQERSQLMQTIEELDPVKNPTVIQANEFLKQMQENFKDEESAYAFFKSFSKNRDRMMLDAERAALNAERQQFQSKASREREVESSRELSENMDTALSSVLETAQSIDSYKGVDFGYIRELIEPIKGSLFFQATEDMPQFKLKKGEYGIRIDLIEGVIQKEAKRAKAQAEVLAAQRRNNAVIGDKASTAAPVVPTPAPTSPVVTRAEATEPKSKKEWEARLAAVSAGR